MTKQYSSFGFKTRINLNITTPTSSSWIRFPKNNSPWDARMNKRQIVIIFDGIIHEYLKAEKQLDTCYKPQIVRPRFTAILQKLTDSKFVKLYEFSVGFK